MSAGRLGGSEGIKYQVVADDITLDKLGCVSPLILQQLSATYKVQVEKEMCIYYWVFIQLTQVDDLLIIRVYRLDGCGEILTHLKEFL